MFAAFVCMTSVVTVGFCTYRTKSRVANRLREPQIGVERSPEVVAHMCEEIQFRTGRGICLERLLPSHPYNALKTLPLSASFCFQTFQKSVARNRI